ncbi:MULTISPECIES: response regulator [unclassified Phenylobacterium]|uniref:response regulator n=1 Tax=unclassified Phenylobacterium TaxID=2640670 RepID=UPI0009E80DB1|nr:MULTISPECIES: response regulator [unclassified Phenylobacterium]
MHSAIGQQLAPLHIRWAVSGAAGAPRRGGLGAAARPDADRLRDARILVVEDETLVALLLEDRLAALGCEVVGPAVSVDEALELLATHPLDAAVLDVNLCGIAVFPVADALDVRGIPFLFATAYGVQGVVERHAQRLVLDKPYAERALEAALRAVLSERAPYPK